MAKGKKYKFHMENEAGETITGGAVGADAPSPGLSTDHFAVARNLDRAPISVVLPTGSGSTFFVATPTAVHGPKGTIRVPVVFREFDQATGEHLLGETVEVRLYQGGKLLAVTLFDLDDDVPGN